MKNSFILSSFEKEQFALTNEAFRRIVEEMDWINEEVKKELEAFVRTYGKDGVVTYKEARKWASKQDHRQRLSILFLYVSMKYAVLFPKIEKIMEEHFNTIMENEHILHGTGKRAKSTEPKKWGVQNKSWSDHLDDYQRTWDAVRMRDIRRSILRGQNIDEMLSEYDKQAERERNVIQALLVTETTAIGTMTRADILRSMGEKRYRIYTRPDERRCELCASLHGREFPLSMLVVGETAPPFHTRCRCWIETL